MNSWVLASACQAPQSRPSPNLSDPPHPNATQVARKFAPVTCRTGRSILPTTTGILAKGSPCDVCMVTVSGGTHMKRAFLTALLVSTAAPAYAADIDVSPLGADGHMIGIYGEIGPNDFEAFKAKAGPLTGKVAVALNGPGGALISALLIGEYVRLKGWATFVLDECYSACASIWLAGTPRTMTPTAKIGFHAASLNGQEKGRGNALVGAYMNRLGLGYDAIGWATTASPHDITLLTPSKAKELGIDVQVLQPDSKQANA